jgi:hypothetical protein
MKAEQELFESGPAMTTPAADQTPSEANVPARLANPTDPAALSKTVARAGMTYREDFRSGFVAIYCATGKGTRIEYELIEVQILPAGELNGRSYPVREAFPSNSQWGETGWTFTNNSHRDPLAAAMAKAEQIVK